MSLDETEKLHLNRILKFCAGYVSFRSYSDKYLKRD